MPTNINPVYYPTIPTVALNQLPAMNYQSPFASDSAIGQILATYGGMLKPQSAWTQSMPFETFAAPYRETLKTWEEQMARPEFVSTTAQPWEGNWGNMMAGTNFGLMGRAKKSYTTERNNIWRDYYDKIANATNSMEDLVNQYYNKQLGESYSSPAAFRNY